LIDNMKAIGVDIGSLTTKVVLLGNGGIASQLITKTGEDIETSVRDVVQTVAEQAGLRFGDDDYIVTTGIGGKSVPFATESKAITTCLARGVSRIFAPARMTIDIGAETSTVVKLNERGRVNDWGNQDKCAAGTGIFLEQMAKLMQLPLEKMAELSFEAKEPADITNTCAVFAESEVISHIHRDPPTPREDVIAGIFASTVSRIMVICKRVGIQKEVAITGGVALNRGVVKQLEAELGFAVLIPEEPRIVAALGAAILAQEGIDKRQNR
jgi:predicted CoA-substrate-specific enzyme activase